MENKEQKCTCEWQDIRAFTEQANTMANNFIKDGGIMIQKKAENIDDLYNFFAVKKENDGTKQAIFGTVDVSRFKRGALYERGLSNEGLLKRILDLRLICENDNVFSDRIKQSGFITKNVHWQLGWFLEKADDYKATDKEILDFMDSNKIPVAEQERNFVEKESAEKSSKTVVKEQDGEIRSLIHTAYAKYSRQLSKTKFKDMDISELYWKGQIDQIALKPVLTEALPKKSFKALVNKTENAEDLFNLLYKTWQESNFKDELSTVIQKAAYTAEEIKFGKDNNYERQ